MLRNVPHSNYIRYLIGLLVFTLLVFMCGVRVARMFTWYLDAVKLDSVNTRILRYAPGLGLHLDRHGLYYLNVSRTSKATWRVRSITSTDLTFEQHAVSRVTGVSRQTLSHDQIKVS